MALPVQQHEIGMGSPHHVTCLSPLRGRRIPLITHKAPERRNRMLRLVVDAEGRAHEPSVRRRRVQKRPRMGPAGGRETPHRRVAAGSQGRWLSTLASRATARALLASRASPDVVGFGRARHAPGTRRPSSGRSCHPEDRELCGEQLEELGPGGADQDRRLMHRLASTESGSGLSQGVETKRYTIAHVSIRSNLSRSSIDRRSDWLSSRRRAVWQHKTEHCCAQGPHAARSPSPGKGPSREYPGRPQTGSPALSTWPPAPSPAAVLYSMPSGWPFKTHS